MHQACIVMAERAATLAAVHQTRIVMAASVLNMDSVRVLHAMGAMPSPASVRKAVV